MSEDSKKISNFVVRDKLILDLESSLEKELNEITYIINSSFSPSDLVQCPRRLFFKLNNKYKSISNEKLRNNEITTSKWISNLKKCKKCRILKENACLSDCNYQLVGNADAIIELLNRLIVVKIKVVTHNDFTKIIKKNARRKDVVETMIYMWMAEVKDGLLIYDNESNNEYRIFHVLYYNPIINSVKNKCLKILKHKQEGLIPCRPYQDPNNIECENCEFTNNCWKGKYD